MERAKRRLAWTKPVGLALWILEWTFGWSGYLGSLGWIVEVAWWLGLGYFVLDGRLGKRPAWLHTWGWMLAVLSIAILRAWWIGVEGINLYAEMLLGELRGMSSPASPIVSEFLAFGAVLTSALFGLLIGTVATMEATVIGAMSWLGDLFRERPEKPRVGFLPRLAVLVLQVPIVLALVLLGVSVVAGVVGSWAHPDNPGVLRGSVVGAELFTAIVVGLGVWALAVLHVRRLEALARGTLPTRVVLALFAVGGAAGWVLLRGVGPRSIAGALVWLVLQLAALLWARPSPRGPAPAPAPTRARGSGAR